MLHVESNRYVLYYGSESITVDCTADAIITALKGYRYKDQPIMLTLPSNACYATMIDLASLPNKPSYQQLLYAMEENLPLAAEEVVGAVVLPHDAKEKSAETLAIAIKHQSLLLLIQELEAANVRIEHICPQSMIGIENLLSEHPEVNSCYLLYQVNDTLEIFYIDHQKTQPALNLWLHQSTNTKKLNQTLSILLDQKQAKVIAVNVEQHILDNIAHEITKINHPQISDAANIQASYLLKHKIAPSYDLRQGTLASKDPLRRVKTQLITLGLVASLAFACTVGSLLYRSHQYQQYTSQHKQEITKLHQEIIGHRSQTPISDLRIKAQTLNALHPTQAATATKSAENSKPKNRINRSSLDTLNQTLKRLPKHIRINLNAINAYPDQVTLTGYTRSLVDAENIAIVLAQDKTLNIKKPDAKSVPSKIDPKKSRTLFTIIAEPKIISKGDKL